MQVMDAGLKMAIAAAGGPVKFAAKLKIRRQAVSKWKKCPAHRIIQVEKISGIPREELRPDLYRK